MAMVTIRPYQEKDKQAVRDICIATSSLPVKTQRQRALLLLQYCDYYLEQEPENCFVAADEADRPVGYILCSKDFKAYQQSFLREYLPRMRALSAFRAIGARGEIWFTGRYAARYPSHMHIDILDGFQRQGIGHRLVDALTAHLSGRSQGVMLVVGAENEKGLSFYNQYGFQKIGSAAGALAMGLRLS